MYSKLGFVLIVFSLSFDAMGITVQGSGNSWAYISASTCPAGAQLTMSAWGGYRGLICSGTIIQANTNYNWGKQTAEKLCSDAGGTTNWNYSSIVHTPAAGACTPVFPIAQSHELSIDGKCICPSIPVPPPPAAPAVPSQEPVINLETQGACDLNPGASLQLKGSITAKGTSCAEAQNKVQEALGALETQIAPIYGCDTLNTFGGICASASSGTYEFKLFFEESYTCPFTSDPTLVPPPTTVNPTPSTPSTPSTM